MKKLYLLLLLMCVTCISLQAQRAVSGTVIDEDGEPLIGVNVVAKGSTIGTITDFDGNYSLDVPDGTEQLTFSYIGYLVQILDLGASNVIDVTLKEDVVGMDEVVVTALGIAREKKALGYATQKVEVDDVTNAREQNLVSALASKSAGVQVTQSSGSPGGGASIKIRGNSSLSSGSPLFVVDGVILDNSTFSTEGTTAGVAYSNRMIDINPNDIEDINILKGPTAVALYGTQASEGAVVITTKSGKGGKGKKRGLNVTYSGAVTFDQVNKMPELNDMYGQGSGGNYQGPSTGQGSSWGPLLSDLRFVQEGATDADGNAIDYNPITGDRLIVHKDDPNASSTVIPVINNVDDFYQTGVGNEHHISLSGSSDKASYYLGIGRSNKNGIVPLSNFARNTIKVKGDASLSDKVKVFSSVNYTQSGGRRVQQGSNLSGVMLGLLRTPPSFDNTNGETDVESTEAYLNADGSQRNYRGGSGYDNPFWTINQNPFTDDVNRVFGNVGTSIDPLNFVNITYRAGFDIYSDRRQQIFAIGSRSYPGGRIVEDAYFFKKYTSDLLVTLSQKFTDDLGGSLLLGHSYQNNYVNNLFQTGDDLIVPDFYNMVNVATINQAESGDFTGRDELSGIFAQLKLDFARTVYLDASIRRDASSTFGDRKPYFWYPAASLSFVFTEPLGLTDNKYLSFGKLRLSYADVGIPPGRYATSNGYVTSSFGGGYLGTLGFPFLGTPGYTVSTSIGNPAVEPERQASFEVGTDLRFFNGRLTADMAYYVQKSRKVLLYVPTAPASGSAEFYQNAATVQNKGFELVLTGTPVKTKNFEWYSEVNFSRNRNLVTALADGVESIGLSGFTGIQSRAVAGYAFGTIFGGQWLRDDAGNLVIENNPQSSNFGYPILDPEEGVLGDPNPDWNMGIRNTFSAFGVSLSALLDIKKGGDMWNGTKGALTFFGASALTENRGEIIVFDGVAGTLGDTNDDGVLEAVTDGSANTVAVPLDQAWYQGNGGGFGSVSETFVEDASWFRLREITLSYSLPKSITEKMRFTDLSLNVTGRNLLLITPYTGIDPETNLTGQTAGFGLDYFNMPNTKGFTLGLQAKF